jgi:hypothetical protein
LTGTDPAFQTPYNVFLNNPQKPLGAAKNFEILFDKQIFVLYTTAIQKKYNMLSGIAR